MRFTATLKRHFPEAVPEEAFVAWSFAALAHWGFSAENTIACVGACRDEIARPLFRLVQALWGEAFNFASLGGMLLAGRTGFSAAAQHAPTLHGRQRYVYYAFPHIGIGEDGAIGRTQRPGQDEPSLACGALAALHADLHASDAPAGLDMDDIEQSLLKLRLTRALNGRLPSDLVDLTYTAHDAVVADLEHLIALMLDPAVCDYAVLTGIQIHGPARRHHVWPGRAYAVINGQRHTLKVDVPLSSAP